MAANDQSKISFFPSLKGFYRDSQLFLVLSTEMTFVTPVASGAAGRANVGLCSASSLLTFSELFSPAFIPYTVILHDCYRLEKYL